MSSLGRGGAYNDVAPEASRDGEAAAAGRGWKILTLSAGSDAALQGLSELVGQHLLRHRDESLDDAAFTLQTERAGSSRRRAVVCRNREEACAALLPGSVSSEDAAWSCRGVADREPPDVVFMFPGVGEQYVGMGRGLYEAESVYRSHFDRCAAALLDISDIDLHAELDPGRGRLQEATRAEAPRMKRTALTHPAIFATELALAQLWMSWGVSPSAMIGHSLGEYAVACIAGVMSLDDAVRLVARRSALIESLTTGAMLAVATSESELRSLLPADLSIAAVNAPSRCVVAGSKERVSAFESVLDDRGLAHRYVNASHAFHSYIMESIYPDLIALFDGIQLQPPSVPYLSNLTGDWITPEQATDPTHWARHTCQAVRFGDGIARLSETGRYAFLEIGPGRSLASFVTQQLKATARPRPQISPSLPAAQDRLSDVELTARSLGRIWCEGVAVDWPAYHANESRRRVRLPTPAETGTDHPGLHPANGEPRGAIEEMQAQIWSAALGLPTIDRNDDFFGLGGDSLVAAKVLNRVRDALQLSLPLKTLFEYPTLREFSARVELMLLEEIEALSDEEALRQVVELDAMAEVSDSSQ